MVWSSTVTYFFKIGLNWIFDWLIRIDNWILICKILNISKLVSRDELFHNIFFSIFTFSYSGSAFSSGVFVLHILVHAIPALLLYLYVIAWIFSFTRPSRENHRATVALFWWIFNNVSFIPYNFYLDLNVPRSIPLFVLFYLILFIILMNYHKSLYFCLVSFKLRWINWFWWFHWMNLRERGYHALGSIMPQF